MNWQSKVEEVGLNFHTPDGQPYWDESVYYQLTSQEVDTIEAAANELHMRCIDAAQHIIDKNLFRRLGIPEQAAPSILKSWERDDFSLYGRFDLIYDGQTPPKMLEYNADTPTALVEAAVAQWYWLQETNSHCDQFNSIHEKLIAAWRKYAPNHTVYLGGVKDSLEDAQTVLYIQDTCHQAGVSTRQLYIEELGYDAVMQRFVGLDNKSVLSFFKLYPWEWMWQEEFSSYVAQDICHFIEPAWKMLLSNKGLLPVLWELFPGHPNLLPAYFNPGEFKAGEIPSGYVQKPKLGREGANIKVINRGLTLEETGGDYGAEGFVYQAVGRVPSFEGNHPILGAWIVNHEACGLGIREDRSRITGNFSRFVPHLF